MYVLYKNQYICKKIDAETDKEELVFCLALSEDFTQTTDEVPVITEAAAEEMIPVQTYAIDGCELLWIFDSNNSNAANIKSNNLLAVHQDSTGRMQLIWNMKEAVLREECCVSVSLGEDRTFSFNTFNGKRFTMKAEGGTVEPIDSRVTK